MNYQIHRRKSFRGGWNPSQLGADLALWLDAADSATVSIVSSAVSQWADKSGNGRHATQSNSSLRPSYSVNGLNGSGTLTFDGVGDRLNYAAGVLPFTICAVAQTSTTALNKTMAGAIKTSGTGAVDAFYLQGSNPARLATFGLGTLADSSGLGDFFSTAGIFSASQPFIFLGRHDSSTVTTWLNGVQGTVDTTVSTLRGVGAGVIGAGYYNGSVTDFWPGSISEIIVCSTPQSDTTIRVLEGYLAHKWGLTSLLDLSHPYKSAPP